MSKNKNKAEMSDNPGAAAFAKALSYHGYPFQYRTLKEASDAIDVRRTSGWVFHLAEFPVEVRGIPTRIDYVLGWKDQPNYLIVECKRANPALSRWCFAKAPFVQRESGDCLLREVAKYGRHSNAISFGGEKGMPLTDAYHIAFEMKTQEKKGDSGGSSGRGAIEEASSQVCRGLYGLIELLGNSLPDVSKDWKIILLPVILTTARLFAGEVAKPTG